MVDTEIVTTFVRSSVPDLDELNGFFERMSDPEDIEAVSLYRIKVHAMKHSAAVIGEAALSEAAKALEMAARDLEPSGDGADVKKASLFIRENHAPFISEYRRVSGELRKALFGESDEQKVMDNETLLKNLDLAAEAMGNFDTLTLNDIMLSLYEYSFSSETLKGVVSSLQEAVRDFDRKSFDSAVKKIRDIIYNSEKADV